MFDMKTEKTIELEIDNQTVTAKEGSTILDVAKAAGIEIPTLCHMKDLLPGGACRLCTVEVEGSRSLVPACAYPASEGMKVVTNNARVRRARKTIIELLIEDHPQECLICVRNGNCELQTLAARYGVREHRYFGECKQHAIDISSPSIERDPAKCILCGRCVRTCGEVQKIGAIDFVNRGFRSIVTTPFNKGLNQSSSCILCGQCILSCPVAALREKSSLKEVVNAIENDEKFTIVQVAPAVRSALGEEFGLPAGSNVTGKMVTALRRLGFSKVFDTNFAADLTIMEEANEFIGRVQNGGTLPMFTSCCPGWVKYIEHYYPSLLTHLSSCKSPHEMEGAIIKTYYARKMGLVPHNIYVTSIMPCTVKKFEASRVELSEETLPDVDAVLTSRELARWINLAGLDFANLPESEFDNPLGESSGAAVIFGSSGGVMEAAIRTAHYMLKGENMPSPELMAVRGNDHLKSAAVNIDGLTINVAVVNGIGGIAPVMESILDGTCEYHFIEVMACPGGCVNGGGQPIRKIANKVEKRRETLYGLDTCAVKRNSHDNEAVKVLYNEYLENPGSDKAHKILHTHYSERE